MAISNREVRSIIRKAVKRVPEGDEVRHLNIMPMMDMMTILLVAFIFQAATGAAALNAGTVDLPTSKSQEEMLVEGATMVIISKNAIVVEQEKVVSVKDGQIDASQKLGGVLGNKIPRLTRYLGALRRSNEAEAAKKRTRSKTNRRTRNHCRCNDPLWTAHSRVL